jgi:CRISPR-associated protein Cas2
LRTCPSGTGGSRLRVVRNTAPRAMPHRDLYLVCYDVSDRRRLRRVWRVVRPWRLGGQRSVHECAFTAGEVDALIRALRREIDPAEDRVHVIPLGSVPVGEGFGVARLIGREPCLVV